MAKAKYIIIDNYTGETRETNSKRAFNIVIADLKNTYTLKDFNEYGFTETPIYSTKTIIHEENGKQYYKVYFDVKRS